MVQNMTSGSYAGAAPPPSIEGRSAFEKAASVLDTAKRIENILGSLTQWAEPVADSAVSDPGLSYTLDQIDDVMQRSLRMAEAIRDRLGIHI